MVVREAPQHVFNWEANPLMLGLLLLREKV